MIQSAKILILCCAVVVAAGCASTPPKPASQVGESALTALKDLQTSYQKKDLDAFMERVSVANPDYATLAETVSLVFSKYSTLRVTFQYTRMLIMVEDRGKIRVVLTWDGEWQTEGGKIVKDGGRSTLVLDPATYKLAAIEGKNPFVPQPGETPERQ